MIVFDLGETSRVHDRHVNMRNQVQVDHMVMLLANSCTNATSTATIPTTDSTTVTTTTTTVANPVSTKPAVV